jgi:hypothetical protein
MTNTFYRYEVNLVWVCRGWEVPIISYSMSPVRTPLRILLLLPSPPFWSDGMVWCCTLKATHHIQSMTNTFYMYELDLVWVWSGWEVLIISYSMSPVRTPLRILRRSRYNWPTPFWSDGIVWCCGNMAASHGWRLLNTSYRYEVDLVWVWSGS